LKLDGDGRFRSQGLYVIEQGGPTEPGPEAAQPAGYAGRLTADTLTFDVSLTQGPSPGRFIVVRDAPARLVRCRQPPL
jgi:hypothetical protein